jgi:hypothetical protein
MSEIQKTIPQKLSLKIKQFFDAYYEFYIEKSTTPIEIIKNLFNTTYELPEEVVDLLMELFGFEISDLSFFDETTRKSIKNNFVDNIITFYRNRISKDIYKMIMYMYGIKGESYILETMDWTEFFRTDNTVLTTFKMTDKGLKTDQGIVTDNKYRSPFIELEIYLLEKFFNDKFWFQDIDLCFKKDVDNIRYILSKIFYCFKIDIVGKNNTEITMDNDIIIDCGNITNLSSIGGYKFVFNDLTEESGISITKSEDVNNYYYLVKVKFITDKFITGVKLYNTELTTLYTTISHPEVYLKKDDYIKLNIIIAK